MNQIEDMRNFVRIVEAGSITKAAEQLMTVKSAVSRRLADLEKRLGVNLLTRTTRSQALTESGREYYQQSLRLLDDITEVEANIVDKNCSLSGRINIATPLSFGLAHLGQAFGKFNEMYPDVEFNIDFNDGRIDLIEEGFDMAIRIGQLEDSSLMARRITSGRLVLCASPAYLERYGHPNTPSDLLKGHVKLHYQNVRENWHFKTETKNDQIIHLPSVLTSNNGDFLCQSAIRGLGICYSPDFICYKAIRLGQLIPILTEYSITEELVAYAIYPKTKHLSKRVRSLIDFMVQYFGDEPYWQIGK